MNTTKTELANRSFDIVSGPNKDTLFDSCKYAYTESATIPIDLRIAVGYTMPEGHPGRAYIPMHIREVLLVSIEHECGSGESFNLRGYCEADLESLGGRAIYKAYQFKAYYNSKTRKGTITFF